MEWQGTHLSYLGDLEYVDHLECLAGYYEGKDTQDDQGTQHSHGRKLEYLAHFHEVSEQFVECPSGAHLGLCNVRNQTNAPPKHSLRQNKALQGKVQGTR